LNLKGKQNMPRLYFLLLTALLLCSKTTVAQTTYTWVGTNVGDYQVSSNWSPARTTPATNDILAFNAAAPYTIANVPNQTIGAVRILSGTSSVTLTTNVVTNILTLSATTPLVYTTAGTILTGDLLTISLSSASNFSISTGTFGVAPSSGGKVSVNGALTLSGGTLDLDVVGAGGTTINSGGSITYSSGTFNCSNASAITWLSGSNYYHAVSGASASAIPVSTWGNGSTCNITGFSGGTTAPTGFTGVSFSNLIWNCISQTGNVDLDFLGATVNITGTFTITTTGTGSLRFSNASAITVNAATYSQTGGTLVLQSSTGTTTLTVSGNFSHTGGTIDFAGSGGLASTATIAVKGSLTKGSSSTWSSTSTNTASQMNIQFSGTASQVVTIAGTWNAPGAGRCNIINNNTDAVGVSLNSSGISGSLRVTNVNSASPATCSNAGNFTGIGVITYSGSGAGANNHTLIYNGSILQIASVVEFPTTNAPYNLTANGTGAVVFPSSFNRTIPGTLTMISGGISIGAANTLSLTNASLTTQLVYTAGFITSGTLSRRFPTSGLPTNASGSNSRFPFGTGTNDRSINIFFSTTNLTGGTLGDIAISHTAIVNATALTPFNDNGSLLDKRTNSNWVVNTGAFALGSGGTTISLTAQANNIGSVDNISSLRLSDATTGFGTLIATTGTVDAPLVGKSALVIADINAKIFYVGSDNVNALQIVTFTWTGASNTLWTNAANWTGGVGYPAAPTEVAIINTTSGNMPVISTGISVSVYQVTVGASASLTMSGTASLSVYDTATITGAVSFASTSTFTYAGSANTQNILDLAYGTLAVSGSAPKILPATTTVTGDFTIAGIAPTFGTGTFVYAAGTATIQRVAAANYYNLTFTGNRGGNTIRLGNGVSNNTIDVANVFTMSATNYVSTDGGYNIFNFSSGSTITIPGFTYGNITNVAPAGTKRIYDPLGSSDPTHVVTCRSLSNVSPYVSADYTVTGSKIKFNRAGVASTTFSSFNYFDMEITGNLGGTNLAFSGQIGIAGTFTVSATNYNLNTSMGRFFYNGTGNQTITAFDYYDLWIAGTAGAAGTRTVTLPNTGTVGVRNQLATTLPSTFSAGNGYVVTGSTVNFFTGSNNIPILSPLVAGGNNYNNVNVTGGTRILAGDLKLSGDLTVTGADGNEATLTIGNNVANRNLTIAGNINVTGTSAISAITSVLDFNAYARTVIVLLAGNLTVSGTSQLTTNNASTLAGNLLFNGTAQQYSNTSIFKNGSVNFIVGNGTAATTLTLNNSLDLIRTATQPYSGSLTVATNSILNAGTKNITVGTDDGNVGNNAVFNLNSNATLITANTGIAPNTAIEGTATDGTTGTILSGTKITKTYNVGANYVLNGATVNPFPTAISTMANLTIGANVSLNKAIVATATLDLASYTLTQANNDLQFSGLTSTTGNIYADKNSALSISGSVGTVGTLRFAAGGNITGQFTINRPVTVQLNSDLTIEKTPLTGNFITGTASSILDINGNTLTINGAVSGTGTLSGSNISNLTLGGAAGNVSFTAGKRVLKNLSLVNNSTATLGTPLDITDGASAGNEGSVSVTGTAVLTTGGNLTLKSSAVGTARVAQGATTGGYISGDVTVERYLPAARAWRFLAAPTVGQTVKQSWQENQAAGVDPGTGYGTIITSNNNGTWAANGFDFYSPGSSFLYFNAGAWQAVPNTTSLIAVAGGNKSYMLFSRGNRSVTPAMGTGATPTPVILRTKGSLFQGDLPAIPLSTAGEFAAIGNNYASAIDFTLLTKPNIDQSFSVWDPKMPGSQGLGAWVTFSASTPTPWVPVPGGGSYTAGVANKRIESGQAFMVHTTSGSATVTIKESSKVTNSNLVSRPLGNNSVKSGITTNLYNMSTGVANIADGNVVVFSPDYSNIIDENDAIKATNFGDNFGLLRNGLPYVVEAREPVTERDTIFFNMRKIKLQPYRLEFIAENFDNSITGFLEDKYLHTSTPVSMAGTTTVDFSVTSDVASSAPDRFRIVFKSLVALPVTFSSITATKMNNGNTVEWKVENEINIGSYEVERSTDGVNFTKVGAVATGSNNTYNWFDAYPVNGDNFYRVKSVNNRGSFQYSRIVKVSAVKGRIGYSVYPNPSADGSFGLQMSNVAAGIYTVKITNGNGQLIWRQMINHPGGTVTNVINPSSQLVSGNYQLEVIDITGKSTVIKVMIL
jgi:hypothetical protein